MAFISCSVPAIQNLLVLLNSSWIFKPGALWLRPARAWFLKIDPVRIVCMRVCVCVRAQGYE